MPQTLPEGCFILPADVKRIEDALADLKKTNNAHAALQVQVNLHVHYEYPKHVKVGENTVVVNSEAEELAALAAPPTEPPANLTEMSKADRKQELGGMTKAELRGVADQHDVHTDSSMNKGEITSALNRQLNKEAKTGTE